MDITQPTKYNFAHSRPGGNVAEKRVQRRLAAILAADVVGYSRLTHEDERDALEAYREMKPSSANEPNLVWRYTNESDEAHFLDGLRKAAGNG